MVKAYQQTKRDKTVEDALTVPITMRHARHMRYMETRLSALISNKILGIISTVTYGNE